MNRKGQKGGIFIPYPDIPDRDFYEKIYHKKEFYDTRPPPHPDPGDQTKETLEQLFSKDGDFRLTAPQRFLRNFISEATPYNGIFVWWSTGSGKCEKKGTKLLLYSGEIKEVQDIEVGDVLMNDQSEGNIVTSLARGRDDMYKINPTKGESYTVNSEHILCLKRTKIGVAKEKKRGKVFYRSKYFDVETKSIRSKSFKTKEEALSFQKKVLETTEEILEIPVKEYLNLPKNIKHVLKGYRVGVDFPKKEVGFDPYIIGLWLGDGSKRDPVISTQDSIVLKYLQLKGLEYDLCLNYQSGYDYRLSSFNKNNRMIDELCMCNLLNNKHIPNSYKINSREIRLQVLAGLLDADGHYSRNCYEIIQKRERLTEDVLFLARSLGFAAYSKQCQKSCTYKGEKKIGTYYRILISGEGLEQIPVKIPRKKAQPRKQIKNALVTGIKVKSVGVDDYYGFTLTGNGRYLHHDFTVTHNTCAAVAIAERFHNRVEETGKKILMIVGPNIRGEFLKTIFNFEREAAKKSSRQVVQCTGRTYQLGPESKYLPEKTRERRITKMIKEVYEIIGTDKLRNRIMRETGWNGKTSTLNERIVDHLKEMYSDRVIVIDEVHNRVSTEGADKSIPTILNAVIGSAENIRLILMSATPMVNSPDDIIFPINLMRLNDRRELVKKREIFTVEGKFTPGGEELLQEAAKGYFSYVRGGDPPRFPYEIVPPESKTPDPIYMIEGPKIPLNKKMKSTRVIECKMSDYQYRTYVASVNKDKESKTGGLLTGSLQAGNIVFPLPTGKYGVYGSSGIGDKQSEDHPLIKFKDSRDNEVYKFAPYAEGFLLDKHIGKYSVKFKEIYNRIVESMGIAFVYSQFLPAGVTSLALMLEENGFLPAIITGKEHELLQSKTKKPPICYLCGKLRHDAKDHQWAPAKYVLLTGSQHLNPDTDIPKISGYINREENMQGKLVKVLLGSEVSGEGIDFKRIRQVHILEPWYNQARIDQVKGRAIRNGSHRDLPPEQRNVEVFKYCTVPPARKTKEEEIETVDERDYRYAEDKDRKIKAAEYILKGTAVDCLFERHNNLRNVRRNIKLENSRGHIINFVTGDKPCSRACDYRKVCNYECAWTPKTSKVTIDRSTYGPEFAQADVEKARERVQQLFKENFTIDVKRIFSYVEKTEPDIDLIYTYLALESLMNPAGEYAIQDRFGREGYLIERNDLFIFQPFDLADEFAPNWYRQNPLKTKKEDAPFPVSEIARASENQQKLPRKSGEQVFNERWKAWNKANKGVAIYIKKKGAFTFELMGIVLDSLADGWAVNMLKYLVSPSYEKHKDKDKEQFRSDIIKYYDKIRSIFTEKNDKKSEGRKSIMIGNQCAQWGRAEFGVKKRLRKDWGKCDPDIETYMESIINDVEYEHLWKKIPVGKRIRQGEEMTRSDYLFLAKQAGVLPDFVGTVEVPTAVSVHKSFKILDFTREEEVTRKNRERSKRSEIRGRVCSTFKVPYLLRTLADIEKAARSANIPNLKIPETSKEKKSRSNMCLRLEFLLRVLNASTNKLWFYKGRFSQDNE